MRTRSLQEVAAEAVAAFEERAHKVIELIEPMTDEEREGFLDEIRREAENWRREIDDADSLTVDSMPLHRLTADQVKDGDFVRMMPGPRSDDVMQYPADVYWQRIESVSPPPRLAVSRHALQDVIAELMDLGFLERTRFSMTQVLGELTKAMGPADTDVKWFFRREDGKLGGMAVDAPSEHEVMRPSDSVPTQPTAVEALARVEDALKYLLATREDGEGAELGPDALDDVALVAGLARALLGERVTLIPEHEVVIRKSAESPDIKTEPGPEELDTSPEAMRRSVEGGDALGPGFGDKLVQDVESRERGKE